jgi:PPOX class probable F420-dependent enzyme
MEELKKAKYIAFGTYRRDGSLVSTPTWVVPFGDGYAFTTEPGSWKTKRLSRDLRVVVTPCTFRGKPLSGATTYEGRGELLEGASVLEVQRAIHGKYRLVATLMAVQGQFSQKILRKPKGVEGAIYFVVDEPA